MDTRRRGDAGLKHVTLDHTTWGLDSPFMSYRKVLACTIQKKVSAHRTRNFFHFSLHGRPITKVEIAGIVTAVRILKSSITTFVDDGTGIIRCVKKIFQDDEYRTVQAAAIGSTVSVQGFIANVDSNYDVYGPTILVKKIDVLSCSNEEIMHWTSSLILSESEYEQKFNALTNYHRNAATSAQLGSLLQANSSSSSILSVKTNDMSQVHIEEEIVVHNEAQTRACSCDTSNGSFSVVKEQLKYCTCMSSKTNPLSLDPLGKFGALLLSFLLRQRKVLAEGKPLQTSLNLLKSNNSIRLRAQAYFSQVNAEKSFLHQDIYAQDTPAPKRPRCSSRNCSELVGPVALAKRSDISVEELSLIESLLRECCAQLVKDGIFKPGARLDEFTF